jgi:hypothetical protein
LRTSFIIGFLSDQSPDIKSILDSDYLFSEPSKCGALIRALLEVSVPIRSIVEELVSADCFETAMRGYSSTQGVFEFVKPIFILELIEFRLNQLYEFFALFDGS